MSVNIFTYRAALVAFSIMLVGTVTDRRWHALYATRPDYFIIPHIIIYVGIVLLLTCFLILKLRGARIPLAIFVVFPVLSVFDQAWHNAVGVEAYDSPMMFWSPAHWVFILAFWYVLHALYRTRIETNRYVLLLHKSMVSYYPVNFATFVLTPLSISTYYPWLSHPLNILSTVFCVLLIYSTYKFYKSPELALILTVSASILQPGLNRFFAERGDAVTTSVTISVLLALMFLAMVYERLGLLTYVVTAVVAVGMVGFLQGLRGGVIDMEQVLFWLSVAVPFAVIYWVVEEEIIERMERGDWLSRIRRLYKIDGL